MHLVPNPNVPTSETGTRHRTAERVARSIDVPVISISEDMAIVAVYARDQKHTLEPIPQLLTRANQAIQTLERYKHRLDEVTSGLRTVEVEDLVTVRDVVNVLQRTEMVRRVAEEIELDIIELGTEGRLVRLQLEELMGGVEEDRRLVIKDYFHEDSDWHVDEALESLADLSTEDLLDLKAVGAALHLPDKQLDLDESLQPRGFRLLAKIPRLPEPIIERIVDPLRQPPEDHAGDHRRPRRRQRGRRDPGPGHQGGPQPPRRVQHPRPLHLAEPLAPWRDLLDRRMRTRLASGTPVEVARPADGSRRRRGVWSLIPDIMGLRPLFDEHAQRLADDNGWAVAAVEPWPGREDLPLEERLGSVATIDDRALLADLVAAADLLEVEPVGVTGFCMGGMFTYKAAGTGRFHRAVGFYGMLSVPDALEGRRHDRAARRGQRRRRVPDDGHHRHGRPVDPAGRRRGGRGRRRDGGALRGRRPRVRPRRRAPGPPRRRRRRCLARGHRLPQRSDQRARRVSCSRSRIV